MNIEQSAEQKSLFKRFCLFLISPFKLSVAFVFVVATILSVAALEPQGVLAQFQQR